MIKICEATYEQYYHYVKAETKNSKTARFNKILKGKNIKNLYEILDNISTLKKCGFCGRTAAINTYDVIFSEGYIYIDNIVYLNDLQFCSMRPDSNKENCKGKALNNNSKEFVKIAYGFETIEEAHEYLLMRNKSPFYKHNHASEEDYKLYQTRDEKWFKENNKDWDAYRERQAYTNTLPYFVEVYGEIEGLNKYKEINSNKDSSSLSANISRYGEEEGLNKFLEKCERADSSSIKYYIRKYGEEEGTKQYNYLRTIDRYIEKYGEFKGTLLFNRRYNSPETTQASKESMNNLFNFIIDYLEQTSFTLQYYVGARGKKEFSILKNNKRYFYDFAVPDIKLIVEYHGSRYHYNENYNYDKLNTYLTLDEMKIKDDMKRNFTTGLGYTYIEVYDTDDFEEKINMIINIKKKKKRI